MSIKSVTPNTRLNQQKPSDNLIKKHPKNPDPSDGVQHNESSRQSSRDLGDLIKVNINPSDATRVDKKYPIYTLEQIKELKNNSYNQAELKKLILENKPKKQKPFDKYRTIIEENGGTFLEGFQYRNIVALRNENLTTVNKNKGIYDDTMVMLWTDEKGIEHIEYFQANTEPSARYDSKYCTDPKKIEGVDANGDGIRDLGRMCPGYYEFKPGYSEKYGNVLRPLKDANAERDIDHDGDFDERVFASAGKSMIIHRGGLKITGSAGCQTLHPDEHRIFWKKLTENGKPKLVGYTLVSNSTLE